MALQGLYSRGAYDSAGTVGLFARGVFDGSVPVGGGGSPRVLSIGIRIGLSIVLLLMGG